jgi:hypothetical protein
MQKADTTQYSALNHQGRLILKACEIIARDGFQIVSGHIGGTNTHQDIRNALNAVDLAAMDDPLSTVDDYLIPDIKNYWTSLISMGVETIKNWKTYKDIDPQINPWMADEALDHVVENLMAMRSLGDQKMAPGERWGDDINLHYFDRKQNGTMRVTAKNRSLSIKAATVLATFNDGALGKEVLRDKALQACEMIVSEGLKTVDGIIKDGDQFAHAKHAASQFSAQGLALLQEDDALAQLAATMITARQRMSIPFPKPVSRKEVELDAQRAIDLQFSTYQRMVKAGWNTQVKPYEWNTCGRKIGDGSSLVTPTLK